MSIVDSLNISFKVARYSWPLLFRGNWREFIFRLRLALARLDLENVTIEELNLSAERSNYYSDSSVPALDEVLEKFRIGSNDAVMDFGCGKGGVLIILAKYPFRRITGLDISAELIDIAKNNLAKLGVRRVDFVCCDAADHQYLDDYNYFYFFNPFPCAIVQTVIGNIEQSLSRKPRKATIIYLNPVCHGEVISGGVFIRLEELDHPCHKYFIYANQV
jgi:SAM-dependent methyltransferase